MTPIGGEQAADPAAPVLIHLTDDLDTLAAIVRQRLLLAGIRDIHVLWPKRLAKMLTEPGNLDDVATIHQTRRDDRRGET